GASIVGDGFDGTYVNENSFVGEDAGIDLRSNSVMFDTRLVKNETGGYDIVAQMKTFSDVLGVSDLLSGYLDANHDMQLGSPIFAALNASSSLQILGAHIIEQFGLDLIPNFAKQNLDVLKSVNTKANNTLFDAPVRSDGSRIMAGYDFYNRDSNNLGVFTGYEDQAHSLFLVGDRAYDETFRYGMGVSLSYLESKYNNRATRNEVMVQLFAPLTTQFDDTLQLVTTPRIGMGMGNYHRYAHGVEFKADTKNYYYGVSNELRKAFDVGFAVLEPTVEFNVLGVYQDRMKERGGVDVKSSNNVSVETGIGLYARRAFALSEDDTLKFRVGGGYYRELNNSFQASQASMAGMAGRFHMNSYDLEKNRGVISASASWQHKMMNFYLQVSQFIESVSATQVDAGVRYEFR
ncbi:autotransporter outer membrane beta-barrel domain-containing protein, partial [Candidatus Saccharibacteria bacterium]|nr:autotransporter outer membrane beta-barrel domain-containing protein [Candidatus Saccharibacteria bacterium]